MLVIDSNTIENFISIISPIIMAVATIALVWVTMKYVKLLKMQMDERDRREMSVYIYERLLYNLRRIIQIPDVVDQSYRGFPFNLEQFEEGETHLFLLLDRDLLSHLRAFDEKYNRYQRFLEYAKEVINQLLIDEMMKCFGVSVKHMYDINLVVHPSYPFSRRFRNMYSFLLSRENPQYWIDEINEQSDFHMEYEIRPQSGADKSLLDRKVEFTLVSFKNIFESVQYQIGKNELLQEFLEMQDQVFQEARDIIEEIRYSMKRKD